MALRQLWLQPGEGSGGERRPPCPCCQGLAPVPLASRTPRPLCVLTDPGTHRLAWFSDRRSWPSALGLVGSPQSPEPRSAPCPEAGTRRQGLRGSRAPSWTQSAFPLLPCVGCAVWCAVCATDTSREPGWRSVALPCSSTGHLKAEPSVRDCSVLARLARVIVPPPNLNEDRLKAVFVSELSFLPHAFPPLVPKASPAHVSSFLSQNNEGLVATEGGEPGDPRAAAPPSPASESQADSWGPAGGLQGRHEPCPRSWVLELARWPTAGFCHLHCTCGQRGLSCLESDGPFPSAVCLAPVTGPRLGLQAAQHRGRSGWSPTGATGVTRGWQQLSPGARLFCFG